MVDFKIEKCEHTGTMNTRCKVSAAEPVPLSVGRRLGVLPVDPRSAQLPGRTTSLVRRTLKRTSSTGSLEPLIPPCPRPLVGSASSGNRSGRRRRSLRGTEDLEQDVKFVDNGFTLPPNPGNQRAKTAWQEKRTPSASDILELCQEKDCNKVFEIDLHGHDLTRAPDLRNFHRLRILDLSGNHMNRILALDSNKELREIKLYDNEISTIEGLENLKELCILQLQHNKIVTIGRGLNNLKKLQCLRLDNNRIVKLEISELVSCVSITALDLSHNKLESLGPVSYLPNLEELFVAGNKIKNTGDLTKCKKLQEVDLSRNTISDLSGLANLPNIQILDVSHNQLKSMKSVGKLRSIEELNINGNGLREFSSFPSQFPNLQILFACENKFSRWQEICLLSGCFELAELYLAGNPFTMKDGEMPEYHHTISGSLPKLEVIDGIHLKKSDVKQDGVPVMRPMSASSIISVHQVDSQLRAAAVEQDSMFRSITERFQSLRALVGALPSESSRPQTTASSVTLTSSRCSSRSRLKEAQNFAAEHFPHGRGDNT